MKPLGVDLVKDAQENVKGIRVNLLANQSQNKNYVHHKARDIVFHICENILHKVPLRKGVMRFRMKGKISPDTLDNLRFLTM